MLAAGLSTRFGSLKQLRQIGGSTILSMVVDAALKSDLYKVVLLLGHEPDSIKTSLCRKLLNGRALTFKKPGYREGMLTSLQCGLDEIQKTFPSIMVLMGDQPLLSREIINLILKAFRSSANDVCGPVKEGRRGLPVCFSKRFCNDIFAIKGDMGARQIIRGNPGSMISIQIEGPEVFSDIDDDNDVKKLELMIRDRQVPEDL